LATFYKCAQFIFENPLKTNYFFAKIQHFLSISDQSIRVPSNIPQMNARDEDDISEGSQESHDDFSFYDDEEVILPTIDDPQWRPISRHATPGWLEGHKSVPGPKNHTLTAKDRPIDFYHLIFPISLFENLKDWTNTRAKRIDNKAREKAKMKKWFAMQLNEMKAFVGILYVMGILQKPSLKSYWEGNSDLFSVDGISAIFSRTRFVDIYSNLCLRPPSTKPSSPQDRIYR